MCDQNLVSEQGFQQSQKLLTLDDLTNRIFYYDLTINESNEFFKLKELLVVFVINLLVLNFYCLLSLSNDIWY